MKQRGRKSAASVSLVAVRSVKRLTAPAGLSEAESAVWHDVVDSRPAHWFDAASAPLLVSYCKHAVTAAVVDQQIAEMLPGWLKTDEGLARYRVLLEMRERQTRAITATARSLRITQQSSLDRKTAHAHSREGAASPRPWDL